MTKRTCGHTEPGEPVYPNPVSGKEWVDGGGRVWRRRGDPRVPVAAKRVRALLRSDDVPLLTWWAGVVEWFDHPDAKRSAAAALYEAASSPHDVEPSEWKGDDGTYMLLLEHHC